MKLQDIINTDCYIEFDSNEQLRDWVKKAKVNADPILSGEKYIACSDELGFCVSVSKPYKTYPIYHHTTIEL